MPRGGINRQVRKQQAAWLRVFGAVVEHDAHDRRIGAASPLELAAGHRRAQLHHVRRRLGEIHIHRVNLLDDGQFGGIALPHQRAFSDQRAANTARNRRRHGGIAQRDAGGLHIGLAHGHIGSRLFFGGHGVGIVLLADGIGFDQRLVALGQRGGLGQIGLGTRLTGLGAGNSGSVRG